MVPISARLPDDLYSWLSTQPLDGATTVSDKLRVAVTYLRRGQEGGADALETIKLYREWGNATRQALAELEVREGTHSDVLGLFVEHLPALLASLNTAPITSREDAAKLEAQLVRRTFQLVESLLRQGVTAHASAFAPAVINTNLGQLKTLAALVPATQ
jgi:hypothetical protein